MAIFEEIATIRGDVESWFNVMMSLMPLNEVQRGKEVFTKILLIHKGLTDKQSRELAIPFIRYYYACGLNDVCLFNEALEQLLELKIIYMQLKITDDTFLYIRGVPFLSQTLDLVKKVFNGLSLDLSESEFIKNLKEKVDYDGKKMIEDFFN